MKNIDEFISRYDDGISLHTNDVLNDILNAPISIDEIKASLRRMKVNKAPGTDGIPSEFYKYSHCPACRTTLVATRFRVAVICPIIEVPHCIRVFFYFV